MSRREFLGDSEATDRLGTLLAQTLPESSVVFLRGNLGAGKSSLARAMLRALGVEGAIKSPTYTLIERYRLARGEAVHLDLYRIAAAGELDFLGLDDLAAQATLWLIEWPERGGHALPQADLHVRLALAGEGREAGLEPESASGVLWLDQLVIQPRITG